jgi:hypothetical protein
VGVDAHKLPFTSSNRIWIGGYWTFQSDMSDYDALPNAEGILHTTETPTYMPHRWDGGWAQIAPPFRRTMPEWIYRWSESKKRRG